MTITPEHPLLLGSASPRRREILTTLGIPIRVESIEVDERPRPAEPPLAYVERVTRSKLHAAARLPAARDAGAVLTADTTVILEGRPLGKPVSDADAASMLRGLSGRAHEVATCFSLAVVDGSAAGREVHVETVTSRVLFRALDEDQIAGYVATGEGRDKAGAYAIQGIGSFAIVRVEGSYTGVVGLPASEVVAALLATGLLERFPVPRA